jgi:hypothetical protein
MLLHRAGPGLAVAAAVLAVFADCGSSGARPDAGSPTDGGAAGDGGLDAGPVADGGTDAGSVADGGTDAGTPTDGGEGRCGLDAGVDPQVAQCAACLETSCAVQRAACGAECYALQACLDAVCAGLAGSGGSEEAQCQVYCQGLHPAGKDQHVAYAACASTAPCGGTSGSCSANPYDFQQCAANQRSGCCKSVVDACAANGDCSAYQACTASCSTLADCVSCGAGASQAVGRTLTEDLALCVEQTCFPEHWLP